MDSIGFHRTAKKLLKAPLGFLSTLLILSTWLGVPFRILDLWVPKDSKGNCKLTFTINSENNGQNFSLNMLSRNKKIDVSNDLISRLENLPYLEYKIIK